MIDLSSCARVSTAFYLTVKEYRIREIAFTGRVYRWFHYSTPITDHKYRMDYSLASILKRSSFDFDFLKRLKIGRSSVIDDLDMINKFTRLEELDIDLKNYGDEKSRILSLANLKVLYLFMPESIPYLELKTPSLTKVYTFNLKMLEFANPESVQCIHTFFHSGKLSMFRNLEYLTFTDCYNELNFYSSYDSQKFNECSFSLLSLEKLKEVEFDYHSNEYGVKNMSVFKKITANLLTLGRPNLKVFWYGVQVTDLNLLNEYELAMETVGSVVAFQLQHYEMLKEKIDFIWSYGFNGSMNILPKAGFNLRSEEFISKFLAKYSFRRIDVIGKVEEREFLLELIARSPDLFVLSFENSGLDQSFFNQMAVQLNGTPLRQLRLEGCSNGVKNFDFVSGFRDLELFETDQPLPTELITKLFKLPMMTEIKFAFDEFSMKLFESGDYQPTCSFGMKCLLVCRTF